MIVYTPLAVATWLPSFIYNRWDHIISMLNGHDLELSTAPLHLSGALEEIASVVEPVLSIYGINTWPNFLEQHELNSRLPAFTTLSDICSEFTSTSTKFM